MILDAVYLCYDPSHRPFASDGAVEIENLQSDRPASKIIRAIIRDVGIDATSWESYSLHRCYCRCKGKGTQMLDDLLDPRLTLEELEIDEGHWLFIRKRVDTEGLKEDNEIDSNSSRKRKRLQEGNDSSSTARSDASSTRSSIAHATNNVSNLENLAPQAAVTARSISKLLGGDQWKTQSIGQIGTIQTKSRDYLQILRTLVKTSLELPRVLEQETGLFNSDLVEALTRAYHQRVSSLKVKRGQPSLINLVHSDYEKADELLKGKIRADGSWERGSLSHLDESALYKPAQRFPLSDSGLSGQNLSAARAICVLWNNEKWINQSPLPGLSPITLKRTTNNAIIRQIAELTKVEPGEAIPDGFPQIVLDALKQSINQGENGSGYLTRRSKSGWDQSKAITSALKILKAKVSKANNNQTGATASSSVRNLSSQNESPSRFNKKMRIESLLC